MKTNCKKIKRNKYFLGGLVKTVDGKQQLTKAGNVTSTITDIASSLIPSSGNAKTDAITNGIAGGLESIGSAFGPVGQLAGQAAGLLTKGIGAIVGTADTVNTDTGEYIKGKGIKGRRSRDKAMQTWRNVNQGLSDARSTAVLQEEYANQYGENDYSLAAYGGVLPNTLAYLDDGELIRTPDGQISSIPEEGKPTDSNLVNVPIGTQVLSDKLKVPGTNKTFAEMGQKLMKTGKKKGNDIYAQNSQMLNERNNQQKYNELMELQEQVKAKRGIKKNINKAATGDNALGIDEAVVTANQRKQMPSWFVGVNPNYNSNIIHSRKAAADSWYTSATPEDYKAAGEAVRNFLANDRNRTEAEKVLGNLPQITKNTKNGMSFVDAVVKNVQDGLYGQVHDYFTIQNQPITNNTAPLQSRSFIRTNTGMPGIDYTVTYNGPQSVIANSYMPGEDFKIDENLAQGRFTRPKIRRTGNGVDFGEVGNWASLIGPLANIYDSTPEQAPVRTYTPHFAPTGYDISPVLRDIERNQAVSRYNINRAGGAGTGANLAQAIQSQVERNRAVADAYNQKNNIEQQRQAANAGIYNDWARFNAETFHRGDVENAQNRAAARNLRRTGLSQIGTALQSIRKDTRLSNRDKAVLEYMRPFLEYGSTNNNVNSLINRLKQLG